ncbi:MAG: ribosome maturation factor RimP, partial [Myxococcales bacterium]
PDLATRRQAALALDPGPGQLAEGEGGLAPGGEVGVVEPGGDLVGERRRLRPQGQPPEQPHQPGPGARGFGPRQPAERGLDDLGPGPQEGARHALGDLLVASDLIEQGLEVTAAGGEAGVGQERGEVVHEGWVHAARAPGRTARRAVGGRLPREALSDAVGGHSARGRGLPRRIVRVSSRTHHRADRTRTPISRVRFFCASPTDPSPVPYLHSADPTLDLTSLEAALRPVLTAHGVGLVEALFRRERPGWLLRITIETPTGLEPGKGITLDLCADVSRDLSAALDVADLIKPAYTLEVTSPGIERNLYDRADYERFVGLKAKLVLRSAVASGPAAGQGALVGILRGVAPAGGPGDDTIVQIEVTAKKAEAHVEDVRLESIKQGQLVYDPFAGRGQPGPQKRGKGGPGAGRTKTSPTQE